MTVEKILLFCYHYDPKAGRLRAVCAELHAGRRRSDGTDLLRFFMWRMFRAEREDERMKPGLKEGFGINGVASLD